MDRFVEDGYIKLIAWLNSFEPINNEELNNFTLRRFIFEFDAIDARIPPEEIRAEIEGRTSGQRLALVKVVTTQRHFLNLVKQETLEEGWYFLEFKPRSKGAGSFAWGASLSSEGYQESSPLSLIDGRRILVEGSSPLLSLSSSVTIENTLTEKISNACKFPKNAIGKSEDARATLTKLPAGNTVVVYDVGQASFASILNSDGNEVLHIDAGWPISFNQKTAPKNMPVMKNSSAPVLLSHWDWDHLHGYYVFRTLSNSTWIAPVQRLGPGAARIANLLAKRGLLLGVTRTKVTTLSAEIGRCKIRNDLNNSGLVFTFMLGSGKSLLYVGDADYAHLPTFLKRISPEFLVLTHHGADFGGNVPTPKTLPSNCVVSVGYGNRYRHPSANAICEHEKAGWVVQYTCRHLFTNRGNKTLGP